MKTIKLTISERLGIGNLLNEIYQRGGLDLKGLTLASRIVDLMTIDEKERKKVEWRVNPMRNTINWNPQKDKGKEIEFSQDQVKMLKDAITQKQAQKNFAIGDSYIVTLVEKLGLEFKEEKKEEGEKDKPSKK